MTLWLAVVGLVVTAASVLNVAIGLRRLRRIESLPHWAGPNPPLVSIVVAARISLRRGPSFVPMPAATNCPSAYVTRKAAQILPSVVALQPASAPIAALAAENGFRQK